MRRRGLTTAGMAGMLIAVVSAVAAAQKVNISPSPATAGEGETAGTPTSFVLAEATSTSLYRAVSVVDGDTIKIIYRDATTTVRLIGVDTPETVKSKTNVQCYGLEASAEMHRLLDDEDVRIEHDQSQGERDVYGRMLAYVFMTDGTLINEYLVARGFGREYTFKSNPYEYQAVFRAVQSAARSEGLGLWSPSGCNGKR